MRWFRHDSRMCGDLAVAKLSDRVFRDWIRLLELVSYHETHGNFDEDDAKIEGVSPKSISVLVTAGLVKTNGNGYAIARWSKHQGTPDEIEAQRQMWRDQKAAQRARREA